MEIKTERPLTLATFNLVVIQSQKAILFTKTRKKTHQIPRFYGKNNTKNASGYFDLYEMNKHTITFQDKINKRHAYTEKENASFVK